MPMEKKELRKIVRAAKSAVPLEEKIRRSMPIMQQVEQLTSFSNADTVLLYWSMDDEVQTHAFVNKWYKGKTLLLPCVQGNDLVLRQYSGPECMVAGEQFGIGEPDASLPAFTALENIDLIIVPGVAFDHSCNRMGRGRGFYDRLLKSTPHAVKVGVAFSFQILDSIPTEPFDVKMDHVISE